ncbi:MAG TPA: hypothetical protein GXX28_06375, partial [Firmicutes bacterium]|nr:hypothetical protein [Bacillota bacterium]
MHNHSGRAMWILLFAALAVAAFLSPLASKNPDGLDRVAEDKGFAERGRAVIHSPLPEYAVPGISHEGVSTAAAGVVGTLIT